jgi:chromosome segregation ATPase
VELAQCINCREWALNCRNAIDEHHDACLQAVAATRAKYTARCSELKRRLQAVTYENRTLETAVSRLEGELSSIKGELASYVQANCTLRGDLDDKNMDCAHLQGEIQALKRRISEAMLELETVHASADIAKRTAARATVNASMLRQQYGTATEEAECARQVASSHAAVVARLHLEIDELQTKVSEARVAASAAQVQAQTAVRSRDVAQAERDDAVTR